MHGFGQILECEGIERDLTFCISTNVVDVNGAQHSILVMIRWLLT